MSRQNGKRVIPSRPLATIPFTTTTDPYSYCTLDDGREIELLHSIYNRPDIDEIRGSPQRVLAAIDEYARTKKYLMNVGEDKGKIVTDVIKEVKPKIMVSILQKRCGEGIF